MKFNVKKYYKNFFANIFDELKNNTIKISKEFININVNSNKIFYPYFVVDLPLKPVKINMPPTINRENASKNQFEFFSNFFNKTINEKSLFQDKFRSVYSLEILKCLNIKYLVIRNSIDFIKNNIRPKKFNDDSIKTLLVLGKYYDYVFWNIEKTSLSSIFSCVSAIEESFKENLSKDIFDENLRLRLMLLMNSYLSCNCLILNKNFEIFFIRNYLNNDCNLIFTKEFLFDNKDSLPNIMFLKYKNDEIILNELYNVDISNYFYLLFEYYYCEENFKFSLNFYSHINGMFGKKYYLLSRNLKFKIVDNILKYYSCSRNVVYLNLFDSFIGEDLGGFLENSEDLLNFASFNCFCGGNGEEFSVTFYKFVDKKNKKERFRIDDFNLIVDFSQLNYVLNNAVGPSFLRYFRGDSEIYEYEFSVNSMFISDEEFVKKICDKCGDFVKISKFLIKYFLN